ncbi:MAG: prolyl oligopeptidase family serine peptidase [Rikenellaceae bacterium]
MKKILLASALLFSFTFSPAQNRPLNESVYDTWKTLEKFSISDDTSWSFAEYKNHKEGAILDIKIKRISFKKTIIGGTSTQFFNNQKSAMFSVKDTIYTIQKSTGKIDTIGVSKKVDTNEHSPYFTYIKGKTLYIKNVLNSITDSIAPVSKSSFISPDVLALLAGENGERFIITVNLKSKRGSQIDTIYRSNRYITDFSANKKGSNIIFFSSQDSLNESCTETIMLETSGKGYKVLGLNESLLPDNMQFNIKKGISFSSTEKFLKFDMNPKKSKEKAVKGKPSEAAYEYELWRWNDTLIPTQKRNSSKVFENNIKCAFYPESSNFVQMSQGKGVFLHPDENALYGFELDDDPYLQTSSWEDPTPKDFYSINVMSGECKLLFKKYTGAFALSSSKPEIFTYSQEAWFVTDINTLKQTNLSSKMPFPVKEQNFDKPQPAGAYGQAGTSAEMKYFIVYDQYDVWALPISGEGSPVCITNGYGRKNNVRFKILRLTEKNIESPGVNLNSAILLESLNLNNMNAGFYKVEKGKDPVKLTEGEYKYKFVRKLGNDRYIIQRESFKEAPDYWLADKNFQLTERLTDLNDQSKGYSFGNSKVIRWNDNSGRQQTGVLYTPEGYDSTKKYPVIVYFYETMSQDAFLFYPPAPTTSTINPVMYISRGYVIFMPDIRYEIGWPGKSCVNIVVSGTQHLIKSGIADPKRIGVEGHSWGGYQVAFLITQTDLFTCACSEAAVANMTSAYSGLRAGAGTPRMFMYESTQSRIGGNLWDKQENYIKNSPLFYLNRVTTPLLSRHSDGDEAVPFSQGTELFLGLKRLGKEVWMFNYKGDGHNIKKREIAVDWSKRMDEYFDYYLMNKQRPGWMN